MWPTEDLGKICPALPHNVIPDPALNRVKKLKKVEKPEDLVKWLGQVSLCQVIYFKKEKLEKKLACLLEKSEKNPTKNQRSGPWVGLGQFMLRIKGNCQTFDKLMIFFLEKLNFGFSLMAIFSFDSIF